MQETQQTQVRSLGWEDPLEKSTAAHSTILAWRIHGQRNLVGYVSWGHKELDVTQTTEHIFLRLSLCTLRYGWMLTNPGRLLSLLCLSDDKIGALY